METDENCSLVTSTPTKRTRNESLNDYGSVTTSRRVVYCVHGKVSAGCCTLTEEEIVDDNTTVHKSHDSPSKGSDHCHRERDEEIDRKARRKLIIASVLCVIFMAVEAVGGVLSGSLAIATDAAHLLTDFASFMISLFSLYVAARPPTKQMSFGYYRAEVIGAITSVLMIWAVTGILFYIAIQRIVTGNYEIESEIMVVTSFFGVVVNIVMGLTLHQHGHGHGHGHSHAKPTCQNETDFNVHIENEHARKENINVRAAYIHVIGDFIQSFGVLVAAVVIYFRPDWVIIDPICTFLFSILVLCTTFAIMRDALMVLMEGSPRDIQFVDVMNIFLNIEGVIRVHNLRMWALSLDKNALSAHLAISEGVNPQSVLHMATELIHKKYDFFETTLQIEQFVVDMDNCKQCEGPA